MCSVHIMGNPKIFIDNELVITIHALQISIKFRRSKPEITFRYASKREISNLNWNEVKGRTQKWEGKGGCQQTVIHN